MFDAVALRSASSAPSGARRGAAGKRRKERLRPVLRWVHRMLGLFAAFYVLMASATGGILMFKEEILGLAHPELQAPPTDPITQAERLSAVLEPGSFTSVKFPTEALPAFIVYQPDGGTALHDPHSLAPLDDRLGLNRAMDWLFDLHHYLLAGETGKIVSGAFGLAIAGLILIGLYLWWPWRRGWRLSHARVQRPTRASRLAAHTTLAILMAPALLLASVTGAAVVFHEQARTLLVGLLGEKDPAVEAVRGPGSLSALTRSQFPEATARLYIPPSQPGGEARLRLRQPEELHPNGRTTFAYDPESRRATEATSEPESGAGNRLYNLLYPAHTGAIGGTALRLFLLLSAPLAFLAALNGLKSILTPKRKKRRGAA